MTKRAKLAATANYGSTSKNQDVQIKQTVAPIDRLPEHVLSEILTYAYKGLYGYPKESGEDALEVRTVRSAISVSRYWRKIALSTHEVWSVLDLQECSRMPYTSMFRLQHWPLDRQRLESHLARSGVSCNLTVSLDSDMKEKFDESMYEAIFSVASRCMILHFDTFCRGEDMWQFIRAAPQLVELYMTSVERQLFPLKTPIILNRLRRLQLKSFTDDRSPLQALICPQLEELALGSCVITADRWTKFIAASSPSEVELYGMNWFYGYDLEDTWIGIETPISRLTLNNEDGALPSTEEKEILRGCEALTYLSTGIAEYSLPPISKSYAFLTKLQLCFVKQSRSPSAAGISEWRHVFQLLPVLSLLTLRRHPHRRKGLSEDGINTVLQSLSVLPSDLPICPLLRNLTFDLGLKYNWNLLLAFSKSRSPITHGGLVESLSGALCVVSIKHFFKRIVTDVGFDAYYEDLKSFEDAVVFRDWQEYEPVLY